MNANEVTPSDQPDDQVAAPDETGQAPVDDFPGQEGDDQTPHSPEGKVDPDEDRGQEGDVKPDDEPHDKADDKADEKAVEEEEEIDRENLDPKTRSYIESLEDKVNVGKDAETELNNRLRDETRKASTAESAVKDIIDTHKQEMEADEEKFNKNYESAMDNETIAKNNMTALRYQAKIAEDEGDTQKAAELREEAKNNLKVAGQWSRRAILLNEGYRQNSYGKEVRLAEKVENSLLDKFPEFAEVKDQVDDFCEEMGLDGMEIRKDLPRLHRVYKRLLSSAIGQPGKLEELAEKNKKLAISEAERKRHSGLPSSGTKGDRGKKKQKNEPVEGFDTITEPVKPRYKAGI